MFAQSTNRFKGFSLQHISKDTRQDTLQPTQKALLRSIPKVDTLLAHADLQDFDKAFILPLIYEYLQTLRDSISQGKSPNTDLNTHAKTIKTKAMQAQAPTMQSVINATGVVIHTNLGRSVFSQEIMEQITPLLTAYNTLEYDLHKGKRGERYIHATQILAQMFGVESALLVNNNAASVLLILNTFAKDKEVIISRGELVEIGGSFRIPEVMKSASSILCEVGATNKTHLRDYENAINEQTAMIMKVHQSNFKQIGFTKDCHIKELITLAKKHNLIDYFDLGSGHCGILSLKDEPSVSEICKYKPSLLSFSGDKLFGGPQLGIILGKKKLIDKLKSNQLLRALRVDKFSILALIATLQAYKDKAYHKIPTLNMLSLPLEKLESRAKVLQSKIAQSRISQQMQVEVLRLSSLAGGGSVPHIEFESWGVSLQNKILNAKAFEEKLRLQGLITCIQKDKILLDVRTLLPHDEEKIVMILESVLGQGND